jgi:subtilisin family serine protease
MDKGTIHVAVIDDGINEKLYNTGCLLHNIEITNELEIWERADYDPYSPSHGTTCAAIIRRYSPDTVLSSIKILSDISQHGMREQLLKALDWCIANNVRLVNLSLGTIDYRDFDAIRAAINNAYKKGVLIIAACNNKNVFTYPAALSNVLGVKCYKNGAHYHENLKLQTKSSKLGHSYNSYALDGIEITATSEHNLTQYNGEESYTQPVIVMLLHMSQLWCITCC